MNDGVAEYLSPGSLQLRRRQRPLTFDGVYVDDPDGVAQPHGVPVGLSLHEMERKLIEATLEHFDGHRAKTAEALGIGVRTLSGKLRQYGYAPRAKTLSGVG